MNTLTSDASIEVMALQRIPFHRLVMVEARKSVDTRASKAVLGSFLGIGLLILVFTVLMDDEATVASALLPAVLVLPALPVIGVLVMTSEWSQNTASTTFRLEPRRARVLFAKLVASLSVTLTLVAVVVLACGLATVVVLAVRGQPLGGSDLGGMLRMVFVSALLMTIYGVAWGALLMSTPVAILFTVVSSLIFDLVISLAAGDLAPWLSSSAPLNWLGGGAGGEAAPFTGGVVTGLLLWYVVPLAAGIWVQTRREAR